MKNFIKLDNNPNPKKYIKPKLKKSKVSFNLFNMDFLGIISDEATLIAQCSAPPSQCVG